MKTSALKSMMFISLGTLFIMILYRIVSNSNNPETQHAVQRLATQPTKDSVHNHSIVEYLHVKSEKAKIVQWNGHRWVYLTNFCDGNYKFEKATVRMPFGTTPIFIHNIKDDLIVSRRLKLYGTFEPENVNAVAEQLKRDPNLALLDLGAQLGTHTLVASMLGRNVVAVDPLQSNVLRLCKSLEAGKFTNNVTVFFNALSDDHRKISFYLWKGNIGGTRIAPSNTTKSDSADSLYTVLLDDLLPFIPFKKAFMKIDVEGHEMQVIRGGAQFFKNIDVAGILMEWVFHKHDSGKELKSLMTNLGFKPFIVRNKSPLIDVNHKTWPADVLWLK